jgi:uncharacterized membrane protein YphA (DoxX/SURF4 family)
MPSSDTQAVGLESAHNREWEQGSFEAAGRAPADVPWSTPRKVAFRFVFTYLLVVLCPFSISIWFLWIGVQHALHHLGPVKAYESIWHKIAPWVGAHILHLRHPITIFISGGSDTTYDYVKAFCIALLAALVAVVWSVLDRNRRDYSTLNQWIRLYVRLTLAAAMLSYGLAKVIPSQMPPPNLVTLLTPFGNLTPDGLIWNTIGASPGYETFCGLVETAAGVLLLVPGLTMLGALVAFGAMVQVLALNAGYDIPVKLFASHLLLLAVFLLLPDTRRLINLVVLNRETQPAVRPPLFQRRWLNYTAWGLQWVLGICLIANNVSGAILFAHKYNGGAENNSLYGIWKVEKFEADGKERPPLLTDNLNWQRVIFDSQPSLTGRMMVTMTIQDMDGQFYQYGGTMDSHSNSLSLKSPSARIEDTELKYNRPQLDSMVLEGQVNGHRLRATLKKDEREFTLKRQGFRFINDGYTAVADFDSLEDPQ